MKRIITIMCAMCFCTTILAQNLDRMNEARRNEALIRIAKETVLEFGPDFFREYGEPEILHGRVGVGLKPCPEIIFCPPRSRGGERPLQLFTDEGLERHRNRSFYTVTFFYDKTVEDFRENFSSQVYIWGDTGRAFIIRFGGGGTFLSGLDEPQMRSSLSTIPRAEWQRRPPGYFSPRVTTTRTVIERPPPTDDQLRDWWERDLLSEDEVEEARRRGIISDSDVERFRERFPWRLRGNEHMIRHHNE